MSDIIDKGKQIFKEEAHELLDRLESLLLSLEANRDDKEIIGSIFRALHTIKGSAAMFGFEKISKFTHELESVFDFVRNQKLTITKDLIDISLSSGEIIRAMLNRSADQPFDDEEAQIVRIKEALNSLIPSSNIDITESERTKSLIDNIEKPMPNKEEKTRTYRILFRPNPEILLTGTNPILLLTELQELGSLTVVALTDNIPALTEMNPEYCYIDWELILTTNKGLNAIEDVFIFVRDDCELTIDVFEPNRQNNSTLPKQSACISSTTVVTSTDVKKQKGLPAVSLSNIRVASAKLDNLINIVGELVTAKARLNEIAFQRRDSEIILIAEEVERLTTELREITMNIRMLPIDTIFSKYRLLARNIANELGKEVEIIISGAETEIDKTVIEKINDPLVHLIRNSIDHGIELPALRQKIGKPRQGTIRLTASHEGAYILIQIHDDGAGIDKELITQKALEKGLISADAILSENEIYNLLFTPGFSTAKSLTNVSGRGVGLDIVKRNIESLRGSMEVRSDKGIGTTVMFKIPLTLGIIEGLLVKIGAEYFLLNLSVVEECIELNRKGIPWAEGNTIVRSRGEIVPYISLRSYFAIAGELPAIEQVVICHLNNQHIGLVVDQVIGKYQTVIKSLSKLYQNIKIFSGVTILGDGTVALILDLPQLVEFAEQKEEHELASVRI